MSFPTRTIDLDATTTGASGAVALRGVAELLEGRDLTPAMARWARRLAATFSSWHAAVVGALQAHPALSLTDPTLGVEVPDRYGESIVALTRGLGPRVGHEGIVPVAVALVELAGSFEPTFEPLRRDDTDAHRRLALAVGLAPTPFGTSTGLTSRFVDGVSAAAAALSAPGLPAGDVRQTLDGIDLAMIEAIGHLRRVGSSVEGVARSLTNEAFDPARVAALAAVLDADETFCPAVELSGAVDQARRIGPLALAATGDFATVARTDERVAAGLLAADRQVDANNTSQPVPASTESTRARSSSPSAA